MGGTLVVDGQDSATVLVEGYVKNQQVVINDMYAHNNKAICGIVIWHRPYQPTRCLVFKQLS